MGTDGAHRDAVGAAQVGAEGYRLPPCRLQIRRILHAVLADFKLDVGTVVAPLAAAAAAPAAHGKGQRLHRGHGAVGQLSHKAMDAHGRRDGFIPIVPIFILAQERQHGLPGLAAQPVPLSRCGLDIAAEIGVICPGGVHHNALGLQRCASQVAGILHQEAGIIIHGFCTSGSPAREVSTEMIPAISAISPTAFQSTV